MIRRYCDCCGCELGKDNSVYTRIGGSLFRGGTRLNVEIMTGKDGTWNSGDFCSDCVFDAVASLDPRKADYARGMTCS